MRRPRVSSAAFLALGTTAVTALVCFVVVETWIRLAKPYFTPDTERRASLEYEVALFARHALPRQAQTLRNGRGERLAHINQDGYRGARVAIPKPAGTTRVVVLGGSAAFGITASDAEAWPALVERILRRRHPGVEVVNAATPGHATWDALGRLYAEIWMLEPDYVVVYEAWNDIKYFRSLAPERSLLRSMRPPPTADDGVHVRNPFIYYQGWLDRLLCHSQFYVRLRRRYWWWRLGDMGLEGLLVGPAEAANSGEGLPTAYGPWGPRQYALDLRLIAAASRHIGATPVFITQARLVDADNGDAERRRIAYGFVGLSHDGVVRAFADCDRAMRDVADAEGIPFFDLGGALAGKSEYFEDHVHATARGNRVIGRRVARFLEPVLSHRRGAA